MADACDGNRPTFVMYLDLIQLPRSRFYHVGEGVSSLLNFPLIMILCGCMLQYYT